MDSRTINEHYAEIGAELIEKEEALEVEEITTTKIYDQPAVPVIALLSFLVVILVIGLVIKL